MKKLLIAAIVAVAAGGGIVGYHQAQHASQQELSALMLANIEALSTPESMDLMTACATLCYTNYDYNCILYTTGPTIICANASPRR